jgi:dihydroneopterin aldolase
MIYHKPRRFLDNQQYGHEMDIVFLRGLKAETVIGIYDWEREVRQSVILDLDISTDVRRAAASEDIRDAVNYKAVAKRLVEFIEASEFKLVETLAERCAAIILEEFEVEWLRLTLNKIGAVSAARDVGVVIERGNRAPGQLS